MLIYTCAQTWKNIHKYEVQAYTIRRHRGDAVGEDYLRCFRVRIPKGVELPVLHDLLSPLQASNVVKLWADRYGFQFWNNLHPHCRWHGDVSDLELLASLAYETYEKEY